MGHWRDSNLGVAFKKSENDETLIRQALECLGLDETDYLYMDETEALGPEWDTVYNDVEIAYKNVKISSEEIFYLLNVLFKNISVYKIESEGSSVSDCVNINETTYDAIGACEKNRTFVLDYYDEKNKVDRRFEQKLSSRNYSKNINLSYLSTIIASGKEKQYTKLVEIAEKVKEKREKKPVTIVNGKLKKALNLLEEYVIPDNVTKIGELAFKDCTNLKSITIPDSVKEIYWGAFSGCSNLVSITISNGVTSIGSGAFYRCSSLTSITIPDSVTEIDSWAFMDCSSLTSITIPDSVKRINTDTFKGCPLVEINFLGNETIIDFDAFGSQLPPELQKQALKLSIYMNDSALKQYIVNEKMWNHLSDEEKCELYLNRHSKSMFTGGKANKNAGYQYVMSVSDVTYIGERLLEKLDKKLVNTVVDFIINFSKKIPYELLLNLYNKIKEFKGTEKAVKKLEENNIVKNKLSI